MNHPAHHVSPASRSLHARALAWACAELPVSTWTLPARARKCAALGATQGALPVGQRPAL
jgi:hypothetical protein